MFVITFLVFLHPMNFSAIQIAELVGGKLIGDPKQKINYVSKIEKGRKGTLSFLSNSKYLAYLSSTESSVVLISEEFIPKTAVNPTLIAVKDAHYSFNQILKKYQELKSEKIGIEEMSKISSSAQLGINCYVGSFSYIDDEVIVGDRVKIFPNVFIGKHVKIGEGSVIGPGVKIYDECVIGDFCLIHAGSVIGSDGFGFDLTSKKYEKIPQLGNVILENHVEIGANCTIDRAMIGSTIIKSGTKLDNLIQVAHNVEVGSHNVIASQAGIAGSTKIGDWNMIGGQSGFAGHLSIGNHNKFQAQSGVSSNIGDHQTLYGSPAFDASSFRRSYVHFKNLSELISRWNQLEKSIKKLQNDDL